MLLLSLHRHADVERHNHNLCFCFLQAGVTVQATVTVTPLSSGGPQPGLSLPVIPLQHRTFIFSLGLNLITRGLDCVCVLWWASRDLQRLTPDNNSTQPTPSNICPASCDTAVAGAFCQQHGEQSGVITCVSAGGTLSIACLNGCAASVVPGVGCFVTAQCQ